MQDTFSILDAASGRSRRTVPLGGAEVALTLSVRAGRIYALVTLPPAGSAPGTLANIVLLILDTDGRAVKRIAQLGGAAAVTVDARRGRIFVGDAFGCQGDLYRGCLYMFDATSGRRLGAASLPTTVGPGGLAIDEGRGCGVAALEGTRGLDSTDAVARVATFDTATGHVRRTKQTSVERAVYAVALDPATSRAVIVNGPDDYDVGNEGGRLETKLIDTCSGRMLGTGSVTSSGVGVSWRTAAAPVGAHRFFILAQGFDVQHLHFAPDQNATLTVIDERTGRFVDTSRGHVGDTAFAFDDATKRLFIANGSNDTVRAIDASHL